MELCATRVDFDEGDIAHKIRAHEHSFGPLVEPLVPDVLDCDEHW